jgi:hypothetical protein
MWNDREGEMFVCHILDVNTGKKKTVPFPIYAVSPDGRTAVAPDFRRIQDMRPGYGYAGSPDPYKNELAPKDSGIFRIDLEKGRTELIVSLADIAKIPYEAEDISKAKHYFNPLLINNRRHTNVYCLTRRQEYPSRRRLRPYIPLHLA